MNPLPFGSNVKIEHQFDGTRIAMPLIRKPWTGLGGNLFLAFWLCGWACGEWFAARALWEKGFADAGWFLAAWLGGWTVGGVMAMRALYQNVRGPRPEIIVLGSHTLTHQKGKKTDYEKDRIGNVTLERTEGEHLLYFDYGADRVFVGEYLREPEREWLHETLLKRSGTSGRALNPSGGRVPPSA